MIKFKRKLLEYSENCSLIYELISLVGHEYFLIPIKTSSKISCMELQNVNKTLSHTNNVQALTGVPAPTGI